MDTSRVLCDFNALYERIRPLLYFYSDEICVSIYGEMKCNFLPQVYTDIVICASPY